MSKDPHSPNRSGARLVIYREREPPVHELRGGVTIRKRGGEWELKKDGAPIDSRLAPAARESGGGGFNYLKEARIFAEGYIAALNDSEKEPPK